MRTFLVDPAFREALVWRTLTRLEAGGLTLPIAEHHRRAGPIYGLPSPELRERAFARLAADEFDALRLTEPIEAALSERLALAKGIEHVLVSEAQGRLQEGITCDGHQLGFRVLTSRFDDSLGLYDWCRHGLGHAEDTLDPSFGFVPGWESASGSGALADRLHALWDVSVDGRTARQTARLAGGGRAVPPGRAGPYSAPVGPRAPAAVRRRHRAEIERLLPTRATHAAAIVERLWDGPRPAFAELEEWAARPERMAAALGLDADRRTADGPLPGDRCPLCGFPSPDLHRPTAAVADLVAAEFPAWRPVQGLCGRCADRYLFMMPVGGGA